MNDRNAHVALYQRLTALYPATFRTNYTTDLVVLFADQLRDEGPTRVWLRTVRDLAVSVPTQQLEAHMNRPSPRLVTVLSGLVAGTAGLLAITVGTGPAMPALLVVALVAGALAVWSWQANRPVGSDHTATQWWWKFLVAGPSVAALTFFAMAIPWPEAIDLGDNAYWLVVISFMTSLALAATGVLLGIGALVQHRRIRHIRPSAA